MRVSDLCLGECDSYPNHFKKLSDKSFLFSAYTEELGEELWLFVELGVSTINNKNSVKPEISIYPNPIRAHQELKIIWNDEFSPSNYTVVNSIGKIVDSGIITGSQNQLELKLKNCGYGTYFIQLNNAKQTSTLKKIVVLK